MAKYRTYAKQKRIYFVLSVLVYFLPFIVVTACLLPTVKEATGLKVAIGFGIVLINAIPYLMGVFRIFFSHFPMLNVLSIVFVFLAAFFTLDVFRSSVDKLLWIEFAAAAGSIWSCVLWAKYRKYRQYHATMKATLKSGAFAMKEEVHDSQ